MMTHIAQTKMIVSAITMFLSIIPSLISAQTLWQSSIAGYTFSNNTVTREALTPWTVYDIQVSTTIGLIANESTQFWMLSQNYNLTQNKSFNWDNTYLLYNNITKLTLSYPPSEPALLYEYHTLGNIILCQDCDDMITKIGPINNMDNLYYPIKININFNVNEIILQNNDIYTNSSIILYVYFMIVHQYNPNSNYFNITDEYIMSIMNYVFPNGRKGNYGFIPTPSNYRQTYIILEVRYDSFELSYIDIGNPNNWNTFFGNNYWYQNKTKNGTYFISYLYGIGGMVKNKQAFDKFIAYNGSISFNTTMEHDSKDAKILYPKLLIGLQLMFFSLFYYL